MMTEKNLKLDQYWKANLRLVLRLLSVWFLASYGCGILFVEFLDQYTFFGFKLGFWFAQQGSIYIFVILIFVYINQMKKLDEAFKNQKEEES
jgi:putative solute:sodium symporter small subunit